MIRKTWLFLLACLVWCANAKLALAVDPAPWGFDSVVVYNSQLEPVHKVTGLPSMTGCASLRDSSIGIITMMPPEALLFARDGSFRARVPLEDRPFSIAPSPAGAIIVLDNWKVLEIGSDGAIIHKMTVQNVLSATSHVQSGIVALIRPGVLQHISWEGQLISQFNATTEGPPVLFNSLAARNGTSFVATEASTSELFTLDSDLKVSSRVKLSRDASNGIVPLPENRNVIVDPLHREISLIDSTGTDKRYSTTASPVCGSPSSDGSFVLGFAANGGARPPKQSFLDFDHHRPPLSIDSLAVIIGGSLMGALVVGLALTRRSRKALGNLSLATPSSEGEANAIPTTNEGERLAQRLWLTLLWALSLTSLYVTWICTPLSETASRWQWLQYGGAAAVCALALTVLSGKYALKSRLTVTHRVDASEFSLNRINWIVLICLIVSLYGFYFTTAAQENQKLGVSLWIIAQVMMPMAVWFRRPYTERWTTFSILSVGTLCLTVFLSRMVWMGTYPDDIHGDFGTMARNALQLITDKWRPFFVLDAEQTIGRPWLSITSGLLWLFGVDKWVTHLSSALWITVLIYGCYLLGRELASSSFGLLCGFLVGVHHTLLMYSRQPYVTESTAPFVLSVYFLVRAFRRGVWRDWIYAGLWIGWSMISIRQFTKFPFIWGTMLICLVLFHPRGALARLGGIALTSLAALVVTAPFIQFFLSSHLTNRLYSISPLIPNGAITSDINIWINQLSGAFGSILIYQDVASWPSMTGAAICLQISGALFAVGLFCLLLRPRSLLTIVSVVTIAVGIFLGSAFLPNPPGYYHQFVSIVFVLFVVAFPLDLLWRLALARRSRILRSLLGSGVALLALTVGFELASPFLQSVRGQVDSSGEEVSRRNIFSALANYLIAHRDSRHILLGYEGLQPLFGSYAFYYYGDFVYQAQINEGIAPYLPIRPASSENTTTFMALQSHADSLQVIETAYPGGQKGSLKFDFGNGTILLYTVPNKILVERLLQVSQSAAGHEMKPFTLTPAST